MKPKFSTGYFTPQENAKKTNASKSKRKSSQEGAEGISIAKDLSDSFFEKLMKCPIKSQFVLNLLNSEKDNIEEYKRNLEKEKEKLANTTPLSKIKRAHQCESPTALLRRRALQQQNRQNVLPNLEECHSDNSSTSSSRQSTASNLSCSSPIPFNKLLEGVVAYVEIKSKGEDRSNGAKVLMGSMGAIIRDKFTKDVTHVIFKDGSYTTYQKAKLMKVHLVSILWVEAVRRNNVRIPEKKFPALGTEAYDCNVSTLCSQLQKDYEGIIREELQLSLATGTPLPSTQTLIERRRTVMTPISSSNRFSQDFPSSQDKEVEKIFHPRRKTINIQTRHSPISETASSELLTDDDSNLGPVIDGTIVKRQKNSVIPDLLQIGRHQPLENSDMDLTFLENSTPLRSDKKTKGKNFPRGKVHVINNVTVSNGLPIDSIKENCTPNISDDSIYSKTTPKTRKTDSKRLTTELDEDFNIPNESLHKRRTRRLKVDTNRNNESKNHSNDSELKTMSDNSSTNMSILKLSEKSSSFQILSKNVCNTNSNSVKGINVDLSSLPSNISKGPNEKSSSTNMSSLQLSMNNEKTNPNKDKNAGVWSSTSMSTLQISDSSKEKTSDIVNLNLENSNMELKENKELVQEKTVPTEKESFNTDNSSSLLSSNIVDELLELLENSPQKDANVTRRKNKGSVERRTYNTRRNTILPTEVDKAESDSSSPNNSVSPRKSESDEIDNKIVKGKGKNTNKKVCSPTREATVRHRNSNSGTQITSKNQTKKTESSSNKKAISERKRRGDISKKAKPGKETCKPPGNISNNSSDNSETSINDKKMNRTRKLYNPDESIKELQVDDETERARKRIEAKRRKSDEGVVHNGNIIAISPNTLITASAKEFLDKIHVNVNDILRMNVTQTETEEELPKKRKVTKKAKQTLASSESDEQRELAEEFVNKKTDAKSQTAKKSTKKTQGAIKRRKSVRLSRKKLNLDSSASSNERKTPKTQVFNRRSTMEFQTKSQINSNRKLKIDKNKRPSIVCTKLHKGEIQIFSQIVKKLGGFNIEDEVSCKTTHLVAGEPKRTINMLRAMAMGCWILKHEWVLKSLEEGKWLPEEDYEETGFSPAVQQCRLQRQAFGPSYSMDIFQDCEPIYIARGTTPTCSDLRELVVLCKGHVVTIQRNATIIVGEYVRSEGVKCVKETWVLDSITFNKRMPFKKYIISSGNSSPIV